MLDFLFVLLFSKTVLLTPKVIDIEKSTIGYNLELNEPISAITPGASIQIDVLNMLKIDENSDVMSVRYAIANKFPKESIMATLIGEAIRVKLTFNNATMINRKSARLVLSGNNIPTGVDFNAIVIKTDVKLHGIKIFWRNYTK